MLILRILSATTQLNCSGLESSLELHYLHKHHWLSEKYSKFENLLANSDAKAGGLVVDIHRNSKI